MKKQLFEEFPYLRSEKVIIRKMELSDLEALSEISHNDHVFKYTPLVLYKKSQKTLETAIKNIGGRDFAKKRFIMAGIYLTSDPSRLVGMLEMFDYNKRLNMMTIGYKLNETYWHRGIATEATSLMVDYLMNQIGLNRIQAFVMPENINSGKVLLKNGFKKEGLLRQANIWKGKGIVDLEVYSIIATDKIKKINE